MPQAPALSTFYGPGAIYSAMINGRHFIKMHGLGNDFVVLDRRAGGRQLDSAAARAVADRHLGVGCDQVIVIEPSETGVADAAMRIFNADGGEVEACGNATRCVAVLLFGEHKTDHVTIETGAGLLDAAAAPGGLVTVDMGPVRTRLARHPARRGAGHAAHGHRRGAAQRSGRRSMSAIRTRCSSSTTRDDRRSTRSGPSSSAIRLFPERANIGFAQVLAHDRLRAARLGARRRHHAAPAAPAPAPPWSRRAGAA